ncbi:hypothetical protein SBY92_002905 [Candida maltosa Xu316]|uniref:PhoD-like phosphatase domain-containing protein n=1 Tax=Candida maltosa (strain Xu316) TaxID=1245528 RepID=M3J740_CANMX|nr:hypothetical protein G210_1641 [Candida maltosa Xu316]
MSSSDIASDWFSPIPIEDYYKINQKSRENVPKQSPEPEILGDLAISCGPMLRLISTWRNDQPIYQASILLVLKDVSSIPSIKYSTGPSEKHSDGSDVKLSHGEFPSTKFYEKDGYSFVRYAIELEMVGYEQKVKYFIDNHYKPNFQFFIPSVSQSMNVVSYSCNGFSLGTDADEYKSSLWLDVLKKHKDQHYHVMLGGGDQIYCDAIKLHSEKLKEWTQLSSHKKKSLQCDDEVVAQFENFYLYHYMGWFGKGYWKGTNSSVLESLFPLASSQIAQVNIFDDHDIIDGFGSYHDTTMASPVFSGVGNVAYKYYMLFQHHTNPEEKIHEDESTTSWILGSKKGPFIKQRNHSVYTRLGKEIGLLGLDCRTERKLKQIVDPSTYKIVFDRLKKEIVKTTGENDVKHLLVMLGVPIFYPRLVWLEWLLTSTAMAPVKKLAQKGVIGKGLVNEFDGDVEVLDDLNDHWCSKHHKAERNKLIKDLMEFGASNGVRITILSGDVHLGCFGRMKSKYHHHPNAHYFLEGKDVEALNEDVLESPEYDPRLIVNVISSAIVNAPPPDAMAGLLNKRSSIHHFNKDTDEDMIPIFIKDVDGSNRDNKQFLNKRNWSDLILASQSVLYKSKVNASEPLRKFPQPVFDDDIENDFLKNKKVDARNCKYPLLEDSLVTTIHFEKSKKDLNSPSVGYEVFIPKLKGKFTLDHAPIKHVDA